MSRKKQGIIKRMARRITNTLTILILLSLLLSLYGCEAKKDSIKEDLESLETSESSGEAGKQGDLKKQLHVPKELHIKALSEDGMRGYQADCEVDVPGNAKASIYQQKEIPITKETIIQGAKNLFDEGEFSYVKPLDCYTLQELDEEDIRLQNKIDKKEDADNKYYYLHRKRDIEYYRNAAREEGAKAYKEGEFSEGSRAASYDRIMILEGEIKGEVYHLLAFTSRSHNYLKLCKLSQGYDLTAMLGYFGYRITAVDDINGNTAEGETKPDTVSDNDDPETYINPSFYNEIEPTQEIQRQGMENICSYSEEEAATLALQYAFLLYGTDMAVARTNWIAGTAGLYYMPEFDEYYESGSENKVRGYAFYLQRQYGGLSCNESNYWWREITDGGKETAKQADPSGIVAEQESCRVEVTTDGVVSMDTIEPWYEVTNTMSDSTSLMDFPDIEELAYGYLEEALKSMAADKSTEKNIIRINETALRYATVVYDGEYTLIPCWFFNQSNTNNGGQSTVMVINAIDGSRIFIRRIP